MLNRDVFHVITMFIEFEDLLNVYLALHPEYPLEYYIGRLIRVCKILGRHYYMDVYYIHCKRKQEYEGIIIDGIIHRYEGPAIQSYPITQFGKDAVPDLDDHKRVEWRRYGKLHREDGPAYISYCMGQPIRLYYYRGRDCAMRYRLTDEEEKRFKYHIRQLLRIMPTKKRICDIMYKYDHIMTPYRVRKLIKEIQDEGQ